jgi:tetratricopeptide (TPR) repeat protein
MGLLDFFRRSRPPQQPATPLTPDELRKAVFDAANAGRQSELLSLCRAHRAAILASLPTWQTIPEPMRQDRAATWYTNGLMAVVNTFANQLGEPAVLDIFAPGDGDPLAKWDQRISEARGLMERRLYDEAKAILSELLIDTRNLIGFGEMSYPGLTHGAFATCLFATGDVAAARTHFERARALCAEQGDAAGVRTYDASLYEACRYLDDREAAADALSRHAEGLRAAGQSQEADHWDARVPRVRGGEPLVRMVGRMDEREYELDELPKLPESQTVQFIFLRNRPTLGLCQSLVQEGGKLGSGGDYYGALDAFRRAAKVDPFDPQPHYEAGVTLMHLERAAEAVKAFEETERLAPGWFNCRADRWLAEEVAARRAGHEVFLLLRYAMDGNVAAENRAEMLQLLGHALERYPQLAPLHLALGLTRAAAGDEAGAADAFRAGLACDPDPDTRSRLLANLGLHVADPREKAAHWQEAINLAATGNLMAATMATVAVRQQACAPT